MHKFKKTHKHIASLLLTAALTAPLGAALFMAPSATAAAQDHHDERKWDDHEQAAWGRFLAEKHRKDHDYTKSKKKEQEEYWNWRHDHPD
jgi:hypothetical protein